MIELKRLLGHALPGHQLRQNSIEKHFLNGEIFNYYYSVMKKISVAVPNFRPPMTIIIIALCTLLSMAWDNSQPSLELHTDN